MDRIIRAIIFGAPGSGKGTQSSLLSQRLGLLHISTGDILRAAVKAGTELGIKVKAVMDSGALVSDDLVTEVVKDRLSGISSSQGFILDGYPRTLEQAKILEDIVSGPGLNITKVLNLEVPESEIINRIRQRSKVSQSVDGQSRADDDEEVAKKRLSIFESQFRPIVDFYKKKDLLASIDAVGDIENIYSKILKVLGK